MKSSRLRLRMTINRMRFLDSFKHRFQDDSLTAVTLHVEFMNLIKQNWNINDKNEFIEYLKTFSIPEKVDFQRRVINTKKPILGIMTPTLRSIANEIAKGDYISFLNLGIHDYYECEIINGALICKIKELNTLFEYLTAYAENADCWAEIDLIKIPYKEKTAEQIFSYAENCTKSDKTFVRRLGVILLFSFIREDYFACITTILKSLRNETEYYVNMAVAWLTAELVVKLPDLIIPFINLDNMNEFALRKTISKCSDSFRVPKETVDAIKKVALS